MGVPYSPPEYQDSEVDQEIRATFADYAEIEEVRRGCTGRCFGTCVGTFVGDSEKGGRARFIFLF